MNGWDRAWRALSFETKEAAKERRDEIKYSQPVKKPKNHVEIFDNINWDKEALMAEILSYEENHKINWSELTTRYNLSNKSGNLATNGGQIIKEWLISENIDVEKFSTKRKCDNKDQT